MKFKRVRCGFLSLAVISISYLTLSLEVSAGEKADVVGSVKYGRKS